MHSVTNNINNTAPPTAPPIVPAAVAALLDEPVGVDVTIQYTYIIINYTSSYYN